MSTLARLRLQAAGCYCCRGETSPEVNRFDFSLGDNATGLAANEDPPAGYPVGNRTQERKYWGQAGFFLPPTGETQRVDGASSFMAGFVRSDGRIGSVRTILPWVHQHQQNFETSDRPAILCADGSKPVVSWSGHRPGPAAWLSL